MSFGMMKDAARSPAGMTFMIATTVITLIISVVKFQDAFGALVESTPAIKRMQAEQVMATKEREDIMAQLKKANRNIYKLCKKNGIYPVESDD